MNSLSTFFVNKINDIHKLFPQTTDTIPIVSHTDSPLQHIVPLIEFHAVSEEEVLSTLNRTKSGSPTDPASAQISKIGPVLLSNLTTLFNHSLAQSTVPTVWKEAIVRPILKKPTADPKQPANYRPISLLPLFGKILESLVNNQLTYHLENNNLLDTSQSGFRAFHSTETALLEIVDNIRLSLDARRSAILILLDLSAAFDTISNGILLDRLCEFGVEGTALNWLKSYLTDRSSKVQIGDFSSKSQPIDKGSTGLYLKPSSF